MAAAAMVHRNRAKTTGSKASRARSRRCAPAVGICDVSSLGKIDIQGRDAGIFLDRVYVNMFSTLPVGKARYGLMLREDGFVHRRRHDRAARPRRIIVMTTTTANAGKVMQHLEFCHQVLWPELDVAMVSVTEQWAQFAVAGPKSRELLQNLFGDAVRYFERGFSFSRLRANSSGAA